MRKLKLSDWASLAEITGTIVVVISLLIVAYSLERNTTAISGQGINELYDANREIDLVLLENPELMSVIRAGQTNANDLSTLERLQFDQFLLLNLDIWERAVARENEGLIGKQAVLGWHEYYHEFFKRNLTKAHWKGIK